MPNIMIYKAISGMSLQEKVDLENNVNQFWFTIGKSKQCHKPESKFACTKECFNGYVC